MFSPQMAQGGPPDPSSAPGGMPPGLAQMLQQGGQQPAPTPDQSLGSPEDPADIIQNMLDEADAFRQAESSQQNLLLMEKVRTILQQLLASEEKDHQQLLGGKMDLGALKRISG